MENQQTADSLPLQLQSPEQPQLISPLEIAWVLRSEKASLRCFTGRIKLVMGDIGSEVCSRNPPGRTVEGKVCSLVLSDSSTANLPLVSASLTIESQSGVRTVAE